METAAAPEVTVGSVLAGTYEITSLLGKGGMGAVWAARHLRLPGKRVAIKVLLGGAAIDGESYARFRREAEVASQIGHPNIVEVVDFNTLPGGTPYLVLEYLQGEDLATRISRRPLAVDEALGIARQIGSALHAAHRAGVVHRDLKPANIFLCPVDVGGVVGERVKVLDFGISKIRGSQTVQTQDSILLGTPQYMSPEQASGKNQEIDQRTDVFAFGAIVYEMLAGEPPFTGDNLVAVIYKVVYEPSPPLTAKVPEAPPRIVAAVARALEKDPAKRFQDVAAFIEALTGQALQTLDRRPTPIGGGVPAPGATDSAPIAATTGPRGEAVAAEADNGGGRVRTAILAAAVAGTLVAGVAIFAVMARPARIASPGDLAATSRPIEPSATLAPRRDLAAPSDLAIVAATADLAVAAPRRDAATPPAKHGPARAEQVPPELLADLASAEQSIDSDPAAAIRIARRTLTVKQTSRAFAIITRAYCKQQDLGNARAGLLSVGAADRARVLKACKLAGTDLY